MSEKEYDKLTEGIPQITPEMIEIKPVGFIREIKNEFESSSEIKAISFLAKIAREIYNL